VSFPVAFDLHVPLRLIFFPEKRKSFTPPYPLLSPAKPLTFFFALSSTRFCFLRRPAPASFSMLYFLLVGLEPSCPPPSFPSRIWTSNEPFFFLVRSFPHCFCLKPVELTYSTFVKTSRCDPPLRNVEAMLPSPLSPSMHPRPASGTPELNWISNLSASPTLPHLRAAGPPPSQPAHWFSFPTNKPGLIFAPMTGSGHPSHN